MPNRFSVLLLIYFASGICSLMDEVVWVRLIKPRAMRDRPWRLERVGHERGRTTTLTLRPPDGARFRFDPGQFAWFAFGRSPFALTKHPFSFSSSAESDTVELAVKALIYVIRNRIQTEKPREAEASGF